jgi:hypothetical protein
VEGKTVYLRDGDGADHRTCTRAWTQDPLRPGTMSTTARPGLVAQLQVATTCEMRQPAPVIRAIPAGPPAADPVPHVLYRVDEPDSGYPVACGDYAGALNGSCRPARVVGVVPTDREQRYRAAADNPPTWPAPCPPTPCTHTSARPGPR